LTSRYVVGIDLGTTNSAVAFAEGESAAVRIFPVPQVTAPGTVEPRPLLPSFLYLAGEGELPAGALDVPWDGPGRDFAVGDFAHSRGLEVPRRLVASAKSWLSHAGADRTAAILPWGGDDDSRKLSPLEVSARTLAHVRDAWNHAMARGDDDARLERQEVVLTVPASFDPVARELTARAAEQAGLEHLTLLEEPQAALYSWIEASDDGWRREVSAGDVILVCDVGGGTTDFSLISVGDDAGALALERVAVGDHILLGGDNMDLALAYAVRARLEASGTKLDDWQLRGLAMSCRGVKERMLAATTDDTLPVSILGRGRKVVGGTLRVDIERREVEQALLEGFFPLCDLGDRPRTPRRVGVQEMGLPYAADPAITRHLAHFLGTRDSTLAAAGSGPRLSVLFNGGVMQAALLRQRVTENLGRWLGAPARVLPAREPEFAVARGAATYGMARHGSGVRIRGGTARSFYLGIESAMPAVPGMRPPLKALCVLPQGVEEGSAAVDLPGREFGLVVGEPAEFRFLASSRRKDDAVGTLVESWEDDIEELPGLDASLDWPGQEGTTVPVRMQARVNEVGVLELWFVGRDGEHRWKLEFATRGEARR
jgi:molecular chaperone DnaK (HSP70)